MTMHLIVAKNCKTKEDEWAARCKVRAEELLAIADTIKILNDDDALELFKKTLPTPSLLQLKSNAKATKQRALVVLQNSQGETHDFRLDLISLALKGKKVSFDKVLKMIDDMVTLLKKEQTTDNDKKEYCETFLDKQVAEATEDRKEEHEENVETLASDNAAKDLIGIAKNRMNKFYNPKLYKPPPKVETAMFVQRSGVAPPPPPETFGAYAKKGEESGGVIAMMDMMVADLDKEITEIETEEKENQAEYEQFMKDSAEKRANDAKSIEDKESAKADMEANLIKTEEEKKNKMTEAMATHQFLSEVHGDCDWLLANFDTRKAARAGEIDALKKA